jgi:hypothetical protein
MAAKPKDNLRHTPAGVVTLAFLDKPSTKFKEDGVYLVKMSFKPGEIAHLEEEAMRIAEEEKVKQLKDNPKLKNVLRVVSPFRPVLNDDGDPTGDVEAQFKLDAQYTSKKTGDVVRQRPAVFDSAGNVLDGVPVWGGSICEIAFTMLGSYVAASHTCSASLRLLAARVLELTEGRSNDASAYGFGKDGSGYVRTQANDGVAAKADETEDDEDDEDRF